MIKAILLTAGLTACLACSASAKATIKRVDYKGWKDCYEMSNPLVRLVIVPQIGGRIMEYSTFGENVIWQNQDELGVVKSSDIGKKWHNYGGYKAWNSPQSKWIFPNLDNFYDYASAKVEVIPGDNAGIRVSCTPIKHLGFQYVREIYLDDDTSHVRIVETMKNIVDREIEWGAWEVTQVNAPCKLAFPMNENSRFPLGWAIQHYEGKDMKQVTRFGNIGVMEYTGVVDKIGTDATDGWLVYMNDKLGYVKRWNVAPSDTYPDGGCNTEIFTGNETIAGVYVEMEVLGPVLKLKPGEQTQLIEDWYLTKLDKGPKNASDVVAGLKVMKNQGLLPRSVRID